MCFRSLWSDSHWTDLKTESWHRKPSWSSVPYFGQTLIIRTIDEPDDKFDWDKHIVHSWHISINIISLFDFVFCKNYCFDLSLNGHKRHRLPRWAWCSLLCNGQQAMTMLMPFAQSILFLNVIQIIYRSTKVTNNLMTRNTKVLISFTTT